VQSLGAISEHCVPVGVGYHARVAAMNVVTGLRSAPALLELYRRACGRRRGASGSTRAGIHYSHRCHPPASYARRCSPSRLTCSISQPTIENGSEILSITASLVFERSPILTTREQRTRDTSRFTMSDLPERPR
jgi:hypothetical protein